MRKFGRAVLAFLFAFVLVSLTARVASAGDNTIRQPGDHPNYVIEMEPHVIFGWDGAAWNGYDTGGYGVGGRFTIPIVKNGFVTTINNTVGIGFGVDFTYYGCGALSCKGNAADLLSVPVVMQWNFYVAQRWSVFGEPGLSFNYASALPNSFFPYPVFEVGGRYHLNEHVALTARIGFPYFSFGVSFM
jgi:hypothetical protein